MPYIFPKDVPSISLVCFLTYGVNIPVRMSALMRSRSFFCVAMECGRPHPRVRIDRGP